MFITFASHSTSLSQLRTPVYIGPCQDLYLTWTNLTYDARSPTRLFRIVSLMLELFYQTSMYSTFIPFDILSSLVSFPTSPKPLSPPYRLLESYIISSSSSTSSIIRFSFTTIYPDSIIRHSPSLILYLY
ncbi:hypothetical protein VKT23_002781 [Stygiomarasmius scandens]|uniref:Uncharacterized protein n=1 Tax=Marasmiellus scandens TaxID=2682957 RepID=A0ABR1JV94_9AGAR